MQNFAILAFCNIYTHHMKENMAAWTITFNYGLVFFQSSVKTSSIKCLFALSYNWSEQKCVYHHCHSLRKCQAFWRSKIDCINHLFKRGNSPCKCSRGLRNHVIMHASSLYVCQNRYRWPEKTKFVTEVLAWDGLWPANRTFNLKSDIKIIG